MNWLLAGDTVLLLVGLATVAFVAYLAMARPHPGRRTRWGRHR